MAPIDDRDFWNIVRREVTPRHDGEDKARAELGLLMALNRFEARIMRQADSDWLPPGDLDEMRRRST